MTNINEIKEQPVTQTPLVLFDCVLPSGAAEHWSTHKVTVGGVEYDARVLRHNLFEMKWAADEGVDALNRIAITLANADSYLSQVARAQGFKGSKLQARFVFFDLRKGEVASEAMVLFQGLVNPPDEVTESTLRLSANNRLSLQRMFLPETRIQRRCPWSFPTNATQRAAALNGDDRGKFSPFWRCGYSPDQVNGLGNNNGNAPFTSCNYTRASCEERGMFDKDSRGNLTSRFGGVEFVPASILVRTHGEQGTHTSTPVDNEARYNDYVPVNYGTAWIQPPVVFARNDGNLTRFESLIGMGEINGVVKVVVNGVEIPKGVSGTDMTATGWYNVVTTGGPSGGFNLDFTDGTGKPLGDPYGSMAYMSVVVPNRVSDGKSVPQVKALIEGIKTATFGTDGTYLGETFNNNPAWIIMDLLRRSGWSLDEMDIPSFARCAEYCDAPIPIPDLNGNEQMRPRFQCNLSLRRRRSVADVIRGVRTASRLFLAYGSTGQVELRVEGSLVVQQPQKPASSNSVEALSGGWPVYEFGDGSDGMSGIVRRANGEASVRLWSRSTAETPNRANLEFQDAFNEYQQDSFSLVDVDDVSVIRQEVSVTSPALGVPNFHQAARVLKLQIDKAQRGNLYLQFETSVRGVGIRPGDIITVTYQKEGFSRQPFRVIRLLPALNHQTVMIEAQVHDDSWYGDDPNVAANGRVSRRRPGAEIGVPRPLVGAILDDNEDPQFSIIEESTDEGDGGSGVTLTVGFSVPNRPSSGGVDIPLLSLAANYSATGGALPGGKTFYYAVSANAADGSESDLSFLVRAEIPNGTSTNAVSLKELSFAPGTISFNVYRGKNPIELLRIAAAIPVAGTYTDTGAATQLQGPPDENYDHAVFGWRFEFHPEVAATVFGSDRIGSSALTLNENEFTGMTVRITAGKGAGQERAIVSHTADTIYIQGSWAVAPDGTSRFSIVESSWTTGAQGATSPVRFQVPNRPGATVQVCGRAVNALGRDSGYDLAIVTRWQIGGASGGMIDVDVPPMPTFGLQPAGQGSINLVSVSFPELTNTHTIFAGELKVFFWDELTSPSALTLSGDIDGEVTELNVAGGSSIQANNIFQIGGEIFETDSVDAGTGTLTVLRGSHNSNPSPHQSGEPVYLLSYRTYLMAFPHGFFGSAASGSYTFPIYLPDARVAAADFRVTNNRGTSETRRASFTMNTDQGIRTLSGGQLTVQRDGHLAIETGAAPPLVIETSHSVRDIFATVQDGPVGGPLELKIRQGAADYCTLTIAENATRSNVVKGFGLPPLTAMAELNLDITSLPQTVDSAPGRDLTVTIRL